MFPIKDHNPSHRVPFINYLIIIVTALVFLLEVTSPDMEKFIESFALVPENVNFANPTTLLPFLYSIFLHGGWFHIISNMWFLWIFGDNVESFLGHVTYIIFYLTIGIVSGVIQYFFAPASNIPTLGASGAISGILGAYFVLFPRHKIETLIIVFFGFLEKIELPASVMLGYWFIIQIFSGIGSVGLRSQGGVAWWAHIGGFVTGFLLIKLFLALEGGTPQVDESDYD